FGRISGVLHCAGVNRDNYLLHKSSTEALDVLRPKLLGASYLDELTRHLDLDFTIYFSSLAAITGNAAQADYASANAWLDAYARYRNTLVAQGKGKGRTLSMNWPYWAKGGMTITPDLEAQLNRNWGLAALPTTIGLEAFQQLFRSGAEQGVITYGTPLLQQMVRRMVRPVSKLTSTRENGGGTASDVVEKVTAIVIEQVADVFKLAAARIELTRDLTAYGGDSILFAKLVRQLNTALSIELPATALFEYGNIQDLTEYIIEDHAPHLAMAT
ncbi:MAG: beta-ketoacyl reductase, partial [Bacteroidota bacterium]